jgi:hypothetical protein
MTKLIVTFRNFANAIAVFARISSYRLLCYPIKICEGLAIICIYILVNFISRIIELITQIINQWMLRRMCYIKVRENDMRQRVLAYTLLVLFVATPADQCATEGSAWILGKLTYSAVRWISYIQGVPEGKDNILGGHSIGHSKQKTLYEHMSYSERFPR